MASQGLFPLLADDRVDRKGYRNVIRLSATRSVVLPMSKWQPWPHAINEQIKLPASSRHEEGTMPGRIISKVKYVRGASHLDSYVTNLHRSGRPGAPTREEAKKDYTSVIEAAMPWSRF